MPVVDRVSYLLELAGGRRVIHLGFAGSEGLRETAERQGLWLHSRLREALRELVARRDGRLVITTPNANAAYTWFATLCGATWSTTTTWCSTPGTR